MSRFLHSSVWLLLAGCLNVTRSEWDEVRDQDGDGGISERFGGPDCLDDNPAIADCDADQDSVNSIAAGGTDCDDQNFLVQLRTFYRDRDGDGYGDSVTRVEKCEGGATEVEVGDDCDDFEPIVNPGASEECDDLDRNCDEDPILGSPPSFFWLDEDGDGFGGARSRDSAVCEPNPGETDNADDCDDTDPEVLPFDESDPDHEDVWYDGVDSDCAGNSDFDQDGDGDDATGFGAGTDCDDTDATVERGAPELCNGFDDDCDGRVDDDDQDADQVGQIEYFQDGDGDGFAGENSRLYCPGDQPAEWILQVGDCDDINSRTINPLAEELCNGVDDDCDGIVDDNPSGGRLGYVDGDGDGFGDAISAGRFCEGFPTGVAGVLGDCDDGDSGVYPGAFEICGDGVVQDCDVSVDDCDADGDPDPTDCDDDDPLINRFVREVCDGVDNDCDLLVDSADPSVDGSTERLWYLDIDGDGFGSVALFVSCERPVGSVDNGLDCADTDELRAPGLPERCNFVDDDCDTVVDEDPTDALPLYFDVDRDGFGDVAVQLPTTCTNPDPAVWVVVADDCEPANDQVFPGASEVCDGYDNDCDGLADALDSVVDGGVWFRDDDADGYGLSNDSVVSCTPLAGRSLFPGDCDDNEALISPSAPEVCDLGVDNDCDELIDEADASSGSLDWYLDEDGDGFGSEEEPALRACTAPPGRVSVIGDCDDTTFSRSPAATEVCNGGIDDDCDDMADDADATANATLWIVDLDGDGFGGTPQVLCIDPGNPGTESGFDCLDTNATAFPGATELCDTIDNDCDGIVDLDILFLPDRDGDGFPSEVEPAELRACTDGDGFVDAQALTEGVPYDCLDTERTARPDFPFEVCTDGFDNNCDDLTDSQDANAIGCGDAPGGGGPGSTVGPTHLYWPDLDGDTLGDSLATPVARTAPQGTEVANALDCADGTENGVPAATSISNLTAAVNGAGSGCLAIVLAPNDSGSAAISLPLFSRKQLLIGPLDGTSGRPTLVNTTVTVGNSTSKLVLAGVDFELDSLFVGLGPNVTVSTGELRLYDVTIDGGGVGQTGGNLTTRSLSIQSSPASLTEASALSVTSSALTHQSFDLTVDDASGVSSIQAEVGTFDGLVLTRSSPLVLSGPTRAVTVTDLLAAACLDDCVRFELDSAPLAPITLSRAVLAGAVNDGLHVVRDSLPPLHTVDHLTVVGSGQAGLRNPLYALPVDRSIVWGSGGVDLQDLPPSTSSLWETPTSPVSPNAAGYVPSFQSYDPGLPVDRWDLHLSERDPGAVWDFESGDIGAYPRTDPWYDSDDGDAMPDGWELQHFGTTEALEVDDFDGDGIDNLVEYLDGTWPSEQDTDRDGALDDVDTAPLDAGVP